MLNSSRRRFCARTGGRARAYSRGLWGKRICICASGIFARAARPTDERRRTIATQESKSGSDTTKEILETWRGVVRGRNPKARQCEAQTLVNQYQWTQRYAQVKQCEDETDAGGRIPSAPQIEAAPEPAPSTAHWRGKALHKGI